MEWWFRGFILGWAVLVVAIVLNVIAGFLGIMTWYPFSLELKNGFSAFSKAGWSLVWLFIVYPLLLGLTVVFVERFLP